MDDTIRRKESFMRMAMNLGGTLDDMFGEPLGDGSRGSAREPVGEPCGDERTRCGHRLGDAECRARACRLFAAVIGELPGVLRWDATHHLQAHAHVGDLDYVLIASRDEEHEPVLLHKDDWEHVSHTVGPERAALLRSYAIHP